MASRVTAVQGRFFEKHLIDYDVGSNYGNWQYIAGVEAILEADVISIWESKRLNMIQMAFCCQVEASDHCNLTTSRRRLAIDSEKSDLPTKVCPVATPFAWRAKWKLRSVVYCSKSCTGRRYTLKKKP